MALRMYKQNQGKYTRLGSAIALVAVVAWGCWLLYRKLNAIDAGLWVETMVPVGLLAVFSLGILWLSNKPSVADFLIAAEGELKKVSWSSKKEIMVSTTVVIAVVIILAGLLGAADLLFQMIFSALFLTPRA